MSGAPSTEYVDARRVLLDALEALEDHRASLVVVGAQAIYLQLGDLGDLAVAPTTTDADLAINPEILSDKPKITTLLQEAGFHPSEDVARLGTWIGASDLQLDLLVPEALGGGGRRGARLVGHGKTVARKARGLEASLVDNDVLEIRALDQSDSRSFQIRVAGPGAILVAKLHKLAERKDDPSRLIAKDALDVLRILRATDSKKLIQILQRLLEDSLSKEVTHQALGFLEDLFGQPSAVGAELVADAVRGVGDEDEARQSAVALAQEILSLMPARQ